MNDLKMLMTSVWQHLIEKDDRTVVRDERHEANGKVAAFANAPHARLTMSASHTRNLGNFNSLKIEIGVDLPVMVDGIDKAQAVAAKWLQNTLENEFKKKGWP